MKRELKYPHELIGLLLNDYDPGRCDKITINGNWASEEGYDEDCEEYRDVLFSLFKDLKKLM